MKKEIILISGLTLAALIIKLALTPAVVYQYDLYSFAAWAIALGQQGLIKSYELEINPSFSAINYPPAAIYIFTILGWLAKTFSLTGLIWQGLLKLPAILFDLATALTVYFIFRKKHPLKKALWPFLLALANPAAWFNSSFWGGVDSWPAFFVLLALYYLTEKKYLPTAILATIAVLLKPQALIFLPLVAAGLWKKTGWKKTCLAGLASATTALVISLPWIITGKAEQILKIMTDYVGYYTRLSSLAFNFWYLLFGYNSLYINDLEHGFRYLGLIIFLLIYAVVLFLMIKQKKDWSFSVWFGAAVIGQAFFFWCTEIHERYLFQTLPLILMLYFYHPHVRYFYVYFCLAVFINAVLALIIMNNSWLGDSGRLLSLLNLGAGGLFIYCGLTQWYPSDSKV